MITESDNKMPLVTPEVGTLLICFNEQEKTTQREGEESHTSYVYDSARCKRFADKGDVIDAIIRSRYSQSRIEAIVNNYTDEAHRTEQHVQDFNDMQDWRRVAKSIAVEVMDNLKSEEAE